MKEFSNLNGYNVKDSQARNDINTLNDKTTTLENRYSELNDQVSALASGDPLPASSIADMTDTTRLYVNTTDGYVYYYNGTEWTQGWVYQSSVNPDEVDYLLNVDDSDNQVKYDILSDITNLSKYTSVAKDNLLHLINATLNGVSSKVIGLNKIKISGTATPTSSWLHISKPINLKANQKYTLGYFEPGVVSGSCAIQLMIPGQNSSYKIDGNSISINKNGGTQPNEVLVFTPPEDVTVDLGIWTGSGSTKNATLRAFLLEGEYTVNDIYNKLETSVNKIDDFKIIAPNTRYIQYNSETFKLLIPRETILISNKFENNSYRFLEDVEIDCSISTNTALYILFDIINNTFVVKKYNETSWIDPNTYLLFATLRKGSVSGLGTDDILNINCKHMIDNHIIGNSNVYPMAVCVGEGYITYDSKKQQLIIPKNTMLIDKRFNPNTSFSQTLQYTFDTEQVIDLSNMSSPRTNIYYNMKTSGFEIRSGGSGVNMNYRILLCCITKKNGNYPINISASFPYKVDGNLYNVIDYNNPNVKMIAHRGYCDIAPENTLSAIKLARKMGYRYVEIDAEFTSDSVPVLLHDSTIDRTSNGTGNIHDLTYDQVRTYDFGSWKDPIYTGEKIPSLEEAVLLCKRIGIMPYIEIKYGDENKVAQLINIVKKYGMLRKTTWNSTNVNYLRYVKAIDPKARMCLATRNINTNIINAVNELQTTTNEIFLFVDATVPDEELQLAIDNDIPAEAWHIYNTNDLSNANDYYTGIATDGLVNVNEIYYNNNID